MPDEAKPKFGLVEAPIQMSPAHFDLWNEPASFDDKQVHIEQELEHEH